ncbi:MAG TPA: hypothetical protein VGJ92_00975 [Methanocella sp.]|jgi:hypothetical protein
MIGKNKRLEIIFVAIGAILALWSLVLWPSTTENVRPWAATCIIIGGIMMLFGVAGLGWRDEPRGDERTRKLGAYAASWSWFSALSVASLLYLLEHWNMITLSADQALVAMLVTLLGTMVVFNAYYRKRGDTE